MDKTTKGRSAMDKQEKSGILSIRNMQGCCTRPAGGTNMKNSGLKRMVCFFLALVLVLGNLPVTALAEQTPETEETVQTQTPETESTEGPEPIPETTSSSETDRNKISLPHISRPPVCRFSLRTFRDKASTMASPFRFLSSNRFFQVCRPGQICPQAEN